jgi:hypothetical protein
MDSPEKLSTRRRKTKLKDNTICVEHHCTQTNTNNVNKTQPPTNKWSYRQINKNSIFCFSSKAKKSTLLIKPMLINPKIIIKDEVLITVGCPIFPSILIAKYLFTGSLKNRSIDNLERQKKYISMKNSKFFNYLLYAKSK